jgi:hypothetical protein
VCRFQIHHQAKDASRRKNAQRGIIRVMLPRPFLFAMNMNPFTKLAISVVRRQFGHRFQVRTFVHHRTRLLKMRIDQVKCGSHMTLWLTAE